MKKSVIYVDILLLLVFMLIIISKFVNLSFEQILQPLFFILIIIYIIQHWRIIAAIIKNLLKR